MYDVVIIGAGPSGMAAAIYIMRAGKTALLLEANTYGGQIVNTPEIVNYPAIKSLSGFEFASTLYDQTISLGAKIKFEKAIKIVDAGATKTVVTSKNEYECKSIIIATGAKNRTLGIEREESLIGLGISYCATCDGMFFKNKDVLVVGGGNTALEDAMFLSNYCNKVSVVHRRDEFRGEQRLVSLLKERANVEFILDSKVTKLIGEPKISSVMVENIKTKSQSEIPVEGVFVAIGQIPQNDAFTGLIETDKLGYIAAAEDCKTNVPGIFTSGDCRSKTVRQLVTATGDGAVSALAAIEYIG